MAVCTARQARWWPTAPIQARLQRCRVLFVARYSVKRGRLLQGGRSSLKVLAIILAAVLVAGIGWFTYAEQRLQYWDNKVRELCAKDGEGVVLQRVEVAQRDAIPPTPDERYADAGAAYVSRWREEVIRSTNPRILRTEVILIRARDKTILGHQFIYARIGGDAGFVDNPSTFSCRDIGIKSIGSQVFFTKGESK